MDDSNSSDLLPHELSENLEGTPVGRADQFSAAKRVDSVGGGNSSTEGTWMVGVKYKDGKPDLSKAASFTNPADIARLDRGVAEKKAQRDRDLALPEYAKPGTAAMVEHALFRTAYVNSEQLKAAEQRDVPYQKIDQLHVIGIRLELQKKIFADALRKYTDATKKVTPNADWITVRQTASAEAIRRVVDGEVDRIMDMNPNSYYELYGKKYGQAEALAAAQRVQQMLSDESFRALPQTPKEQDRTTRPSATFERVTQPPSPRPATETRSAEKVISPEDKVKVLAERSRKEGFGQLWGNLSTVDKLVYGGSPGMGFAQSEVIQGDASQYDQLSRFLPNAQNLGVNINEVRQSEGTEVWVVGGYQAEGIRKSEKPVVVKEGIFRRETTKYVPVEEPFSNEFHGKKGGNDWMSFSYAMSVITPETARRGGQFMMMNVLVPPEIGNELQQQVQTNPLLATEYMQALFPGVFGNDIQTSVVKKPATKLHIYDNRNGQSSDRVVGIPQKSS